jgi:hypothetical protein
MSRKGWMGWCMTHGGWEPVQQSPRHAASIACACCGERLVSRRGHGPLRPALASHVPSRASIQASIQSSIYFAQIHCLGCRVTPAAAASSQLKTQSTSQCSPTGRVARRPLSALAMTSPSSAIQRSFNAPGHSASEAPCQLGRERRKSSPREQTLALVSRPGPPFGVVIFAKSELEKAGAGTNPVLAIARIRRNQKGWSRKNHSFRR